MILQITGLNIVLRDARIILSSHLETVSHNNAGLIWGFLSMFVMLDHFSKALGVADFHPGVVVPRKTYGKDYLGTSAGVGNFLFKLIIFLIIT